MRALVCALSSICSFISCYDSFIKLQINTNIDSINVLLTHCIMRDKIANTIHSTFIIKTLHEYFIYTYVSVCYVHV